MNKEQILDEMKANRIRINELSDKLKLTENFSEKKVIIDEMILIADKSYNLDSMYKEILLQELNNESNKFIKKIKKIMGLQWLFSFISHKLHILLWDNN